MLEGEIPDEDTPEDQETRDARRLLTIANVAREFHLLPTVVARDLDNDPDQLSLLCLQALRYSDAFRAYKRGKKAEMDAWKDSSIMRQVTENDFARAREEMGLTGDGS